MSMLVTFKVKGLFAAFIEDYVTLSSITHFENCVS